MSKKQVWFRPDQKELVVEALKFVRRRCIEEQRMDSCAANFAKIYTVNRINEIITMFGETP